jgi:hypothetical protein
LSRCTSSAAGASARRPERSEGVAESRTSSRQSRMGCGVGKAPLAARNPPIPQSGPRSACQCFLAQWSTPSVRDLAFQCRAWIHSSRHTGASQLRVADTAI